MDWPDELAGALPPRGDEPARLRNDIVDELSDHLICAVARERRGTADDATARRAALARFGNPVAVTRRLWFDHMKGYVMTQRIVLALVSVMAVALLGAMALAYSAFRENRAVNEALLARLESLAERPQAEPISDYCKLTVRVTKETEDGEPAVGFWVQLEGKAVNPTDKVILSERIDEDGAVSFSPILPGKYSITTSTPWGDRNRQSVTLLPGNEQTIAIVTRESPLQEVDVSFRVDWPEDLKGEPLLLACRFYVDKSTYRVSETTWQAVRSPNFVLDPKENTIVTLGRQQVPRLPQGGGVMLQPPAQPYKVLTDVPPRVAGKVGVGSYRFVNVNVYVGDERGDDAKAKTYLRLDQRNNSVRERLIYQATTDGQNVWNIKPPEELLEEVRTHLREQAEKPASDDSPGGDAGST